MNKNVSNAIDELKQIVMDLHRSAGQLDEMIQSIENEFYGRTDADNRYLKCFVTSRKNYRESVKEARNYNSLDAKEQFVWEKLIGAIKNES